MGLFDIFSGKKKTDKGPDPLRGLVLSGMKPGYLVDYDMKTWEVTAHNTYDWGEGDMTGEWQLKSGDEVAYLELESDDEEFWSLSWKIPFSRLGGNVRQRILDDGDPPEEIVLDGKTYYLEETAAGHYLKDGQGVGVPMLRWDYEDESGENYLGIEQWGEDDFDATLGRPVEEYQFTNILPRSVET